MSQAAKQKALEAALFGAGGAADTDAAVEVDNSKAKKAVAKKEERLHDDPEQMRIRDDLRRRERNTSKHKRIVGLNAKTGIEIGKSGVVGLPGVCMKIAQKEHEALLTDMRVVSSTTREKSEMKYTKRIEDLLIEMASVQSKLELEKEKQTRIDDQIIVMERTIQRARAEKAYKLKTQLPFENHELSTKRLQKKSRVLENRLHQESSKFNEFCAKNEQLREKIVTLKQEKRKFVHKKHHLEHEFVSNKDKTAAFIAKAIAWHEQTKEVIHKRDFLMKDFKEILSRLKSEEIELERQILKQRRENRFQGGKITDRTVAWNDKLKRDRKKLQKLDNIRRAKLSNLENAWNKLAKMTLQDNEGGRMAQRHSNLTGFRRTKSDIRDDMVKRFMAGEDANFELFDMCNFQTEELKKLKDQLRQVRELCTDYMSADNYDAYMNTEEMNFITKNSEILDIEKECFSERSAVSATTIEQLDGGVENLIERLRVDFEAFNLPFKHDSSDNKLEEYPILFAFLEQKLNEFLRLKVTMSFEDSVSHDSIDDGPDLYSQVLEDFLGCSFEVPEAGSITHLEAPSGPMRMVTGGRRAKAEGYLADSIATESLGTAHTDESDQQLIFQIPDTELLDSETLTQRALENIARREKMEIHRREAKAAYQGSPKKF